MKDFINKELRIMLNTNQGWTCITGPFIKSEDGFIVVLNDMAKQIQYIPKTIIKTIEIIGDVNNVK